MGIPNVSIDVQSTTLEMKKLKNVKLVQATTVKLTVMIVNKLVLPIPAEIVNTVWISQSMTILIGTERSNAPPEKSISREIVQIVPQDVKNVLTHTFVSTAQDLLLCK